MICTISFTICGLRISRLESFLDKHMPWISGHQRAIHLTSTPKTSPVKMQQPMNFNALPEDFNYNIIDRLSKFTSSVLSSGSSDIRRIVELEEDT